MPSGQLVYPTSLEHGDLYQVGAAFFLVSDHPQDHPAIPGAVNAFIATFDMAEQNWATGRRRTISDPVRVHRDPNTRQAFWLGPLGGRQFWVLPDDFYDGQPGRGKA